MTDEKVALQEQVAELTREMSLMRERLVRLEALVLPEAAPLPRPAVTLAQEAVPAVRPAAAPAAAARTSAGEDLSDAPEDVSEEILNWAGKAHLLTRLSTLCFLMVIALILRTVTDNNLINTLVGSAIGMGYAALLMVIGALRYEKKSPLAPVFAACGAVLMATIVVETHQRFASLPLVPAYFTLMVTGVGMAVVSYRHHKLLPISLGTLGMCLAAAAIDYPHPFFPYLSLVLFVANILSYFAAQLKSCSWLRWIVLAVSMIMLHLWGLRLGMILLRHEPPPADLAVSWFLPVLAAFAILYLAIAFAGITRDAKITRYNFALPTLNALWAFIAAGYVANAMFGSTRLIGWIGMAVAAGHFAVTGWFVGRKREGAPGTNSFAFAGAALCAAALPYATGHFLLSLPVLSVIGFFLAILSHKWQNGGVRITSYLLQIYAAFSIAVALQWDSAAASDITSALPAGLIAVISLYQYQWCRHCPPAGTSVFSRYDPKDYSAVTMLLASLASAFVMGRTVILQGLTLSTPAADVGNAFRCSQSMLINACAAGIMLFAYFRKNREVRNVAILITVIGAVKVFLYDLIGTHGLPLVGSVFSFGLAAAIESVALGKWKGAEAIDNGPLTIDNENPSPPPVTRAGVAEDAEDAKQSSQQITQ